MAYIHDEALRIVGATLMYEGHTYVFRVYNTAGMFTVYLEKHLFPGDGQHECKYSICDPFPCRARNLKDAAEQSLRGHWQRYHHLKTVQ